MQVHMQNAENLSPERIREFLESSAEIEFGGGGRSEVYAWTERILVAQEFGRHSKKERGVIRAYVKKIAGISTSQLTRLIRTYLDTGSVREKPYRRQKFPVRYTAVDIALLAEVDRAHERLSGPATRSILKRAYERFRKPEYVRLAGISVAHLYNLRNSAQYRNQAAVFEPTRPTVVAIGERRKPDPRSQPGYLRVDQVHQGDWDGAKAGYNITP